MKIILVLILMTGMTFTIGCDSSSSEGGWGLPSTSGDDDDAETPTYGVACAAGVSNRTVVPDEDGMGDTPGMYIEDFNGSTINSITFRNVQTLNGNYGSFTFEINAFGCGFNGSNLGSVQATTGALNVATSNPITFTFSPPLTVPTNCSSGKKTVAFVMSTITTMNNNDILVVDTMPLSASCPVQRTTDTSGTLGAAESGHAFAVTIDAD